MSRFHYLVVWTERDGETFADQYSAHEDEAEARRAYAELLEDSKVYCASLCVPVDSTDYDCAKVPSRRRKRRAA